MEKYICTTILQKVCLNLTSDKPERHDIIFKVIELPKVELTIKMPRSHNVDDKKSQ